MGRTLASGTAVARWGNGMAVRIPKAIMEKANLREGDPVTFEVDGPGVLVMRADRALPTLKQLLAEVTAENRHGETDWGEAQGDEVW